MPDMSAVAKEDQCIIQKVCIALLCMARAPHIHWAPVEASDDGVSYRLVSYGWNMVLPGTDLDQILEIDRQQVRDITFNFDVEPIQAPIDAILTELVGCITVSIIKSVPVDRGGAIDRHLGVVDSGYNRTITHDGGTAMVMYTESGMHQKSLCEFDKRIHAEKERIRVQGVLAREQRARAILQEDFLKGVPSQGDRLMIARAMSHIESLVTTSTTPRFTRQVISDSEDIIYLAVSGFIGCVHYSDIRARIRESCLTNTKRIFSIKVHPGRTEIAVELFKSDALVRIDPNTLIESSITGPIAAAQQQQQQPLRAGFLSRVFQVGFGGSLTGRRARTNESLQQQQQQQQQEAADDSQERSGKMLRFTDATTQPTA